MTKLNFRDLRADEIDCRIAMVKEKGVSLLIYKDARCDMNILDETVGAFNWQRTHSRDNANCIVSIWDEEKKQWISKEDTGTESNTEADKGLASDSFKRACFNWGIGRELYTAPFIWVDASLCNINNGKCYDKFVVKSISITDKKIVGLSIYNCNKNAVVYTYGNTTDKKADSPKQAEAPAKQVETPAKQVETPAQQPQPVSAARLRLREFCEQHNIDKKKVSTECGLNAKSTDEDYEKALEYAVGLTMGSLPFEV